MSYITNGSYNNPSVLPITHVTIWIRAASSLTPKGKAPPVLLSQPSDLRIQRPRSATSDRLRKRTPASAHGAPSPLPLQSQVALACLACLLAVPANVAAVVYKLRFLRLCTLSNRPLALWISPPPPPSLSSSSASPPPRPHLPFWL